MRQMGGGHGNHMVIEPTRFQWHKFKDLFHFYVMVGLIPVLGLVLYTNIFIGPAQLTEIPEGYTPKHWEYHRHPISRWIARYISVPPQQNYEVTMHAIWEEQQKAQMNLLEKEIKRKMGENQDYEAYYYRPVTAKYYRFTKEVAEEQERKRFAE